MQDGMTVWQSMIKRHLRSTFTAAEVLYLEDDPTFVSAIKACTGTDASLEILNTQARAILAKRDYRTRETARNPSPIWKAG